MFEAIFSETTNGVIISGLYQWDYGQQLCIKGVTVDMNEVHFCNRNHKEAKRMIATVDADGYVCDIPNVLLEEDGDIKAWLFAIDPDNHKGKTLKTIILQVTQRPKPEGFISENSNTGGLPPGGSGGTSDYNALTNLPRINNVPLKGNKTLDDLGIQPKIAEVVEDETETKVVIPEPVVVPKVVAKKEVEAPKVKAETVEAGNVYTKQDIDKLIGDMSHFHFEKVTNLPNEGASNVIYLVPNSETEQNKYDEFLYIDSKWEMIGNTDIDLSNFYDKQEINNIVSTQNQRLLSISGHTPNKFLATDEDGNVCEKEAPTGGVSVEKEWVKLGTYDYEQLSHKIELTDLDNLTELYIKRSNIANGGSTPSGYQVRINNIILNQVIPIDTTKKLFGYSILKYNGLYWDVRISEGSGDPIHRIYSPNNSRTSYYHSILENNEAKTITIEPPLQQYQATDGFIEIWGR